LLSRAAAASRRFALQSERFIMDDFGKAIIVFFMLPEEDDCTAASWGVKPSARRGAEVRLWVSAK
jgi:hypothetical protein